MRALNKEKGSIINLNLTKERQMKKLLLVALMGLVGLGAATDALARYRRGYNYGYRSACGVGGCEPCVADYGECPPPPCCEREQVITVREPARKVCGWVCPDGTREIPAAEARHADY